jgi:hypothetical protein
VCLSRRSTLTPTQSPAVIFAPRQSHKFKPPLFRAPIPQAIAPRWASLAGVGSDDEGPLVEGRGRGAQPAG